MRALIIAEVIDAKLKSSVASLVAAGVKAAGTVDVYLMGNSGRSAVWSAPRPQAYSPHPSGQNG